MDLVLASTSKYRKLLLERLGVAFRCCAPRVDEDQLKHPRFSPRELAEYLAEAKAASLVEHEPAATIIGSDQLVAFDGRILGKPGTADAALAQLQALSGHSHQLITAVCICRGQQRWRHTDVTTLTMRKLTRDELERYVAADLPLDCAGSYKIEERGIALFQSIESADQSAIMGLPLIAVTSLLREIGFSIP